MSMRTTLRQKQEEHVGSDDDGELDESLDDDDDAVFEDDNEMIRPVFSLDDDNDNTDAPTVGLSNIMSSDSDALKTFTKTPTCQTDVAAADNITSHAASKKDSSPTNKEIIQTNRICLHAPPIKIDDKENDIDNDNGTTSPGIFLECTDADDIPDASSDSSVSGFQREERESTPFFRMLHSESSNECPSQERLHAVTSPPNSTFERELTPFFDKKRNPPLYVQADDSSCESSPERENGPCDSPRSHFLTVPAKSTLSFEGSVRAPRDSTPTPFQGIDSPRSQGSDNNSGLRPPRDDFADPNSNLQGTHALDISQRTKQEFHDVKNKNATSELFIRTADTNAKGDSCPIKDREAPTGSNEGNPLLKSTVSNTTTPGAIRNLITNESEAHLASRKVSAAEVRKERYKQRKLKNDPIKFDATKSTDSLVKTSINSDFSSKERKITDVNVVATHKPPGLVQQPNTEMKLVQRSISVPSTSTSLSEKLQSHHLTKTKTTTTTISKIPASTTSATSSTVASKTIATATATTTVTRAPISTTLVKQAPSLQLTKPVPGTKSNVVASTLRSPNRDNRSPSPNTKGRSKFNSDRASGPLTTGMPQTNFQTDDSKTGAIVVANTVMASSKSNTTTIESKLNTSSSSMNTTKGASTSKTSMMSSETNRKLESNCDTQPQKQINGREVSKTVEAITISQLPLSPSQKASMKSTTTTSNGNLKSNVSQPGDNRQIQQIKSVSLQSVHATSVASTRIPEMSNGHQSVIGEKEKSKVAFMKSMKIKTPSLTPITSPKTKSAYHTPLNLTTDDRFSKSNEHNIPISIKDGERGITLSFSSDLSSHEKHNYHDNSDSCSVFPEANTSMINSPLNSQPVSRPVFNDIRNSVPISHRLTDTFAYQNDSPPKTQTQKNRNKNTSLWSKLYKAFGNSFLNDIPVQQPKEEEIQKPPKRRKTGKSGSTCKSKKKSKSGSTQVESDDCTTLSPFGKYSLEACLFICILTFIALLADVRIEVFVCYVLAAYYTFFVLRIFTVL